MIDIADTEAVLTYAKRRHEELEADRNRPPNGLMEFIFGRRRDFFGAEKGDWNCLIALNLIVWRGKLQNCPMLCSPEPHE